MFTIPISAFTMADLGVHDPDFDVHDAPIFVFTMNRRAHEHRLPRLVVAQRPRLPRSAVPSVLREARRRGATVQRVPRRVYLGAIVVLVTALRHGAGAVRVAKLREWFGVTWPTLARWRAWWTETFPMTDFWRSVGARFSPPVTTAMLPESLRQRFAQAEESDSLIAVLRFLAPITARARRRESG